VLEPVFEAFSFGKGRSGGGRRQPELC
jgi:hypothetical protein